MDYQLQFEKGLVQLIAPCPPNITEEQAWEQRVAALRQIILAHGEALSLSGPLRALYTGWYQLGQSSPIHTRIERLLLSFRLPINFEERDENGTYLVSQILRGTDALGISSLMRRKGFVEAVRQHCLPGLQAECEKYRAFEWGTYWEAHPQSEERAQFEGKYLGTRRALSFASQIAENALFIHPTLGCGGLEAPAIAYLRLIPQTHKLSRKFYCILSRSYLRIVKGDQAIIFRYCHSLERHWQRWTQKPTEDTFLGDGAFCVAKKIERLIDGRWEPYAKLKLKAPGATRGVRGILLAEATLTGLRAVPICRRNDKGQVWQYTPRASSDLQQNRPVEYLARLKILIGAIKDLAAAHAAGGAHRDFKAENVLIFGSGEGALGDWGFFTNLPLDELVQGTPCYYADEIIRKLTDWSLDAWQRADCFAVGAILSEVMYNIDILTLRGPIERAIVNKKEIEVPGPYRKSKWETVQTPNGMAHELDLRLRPLCQQLLGPPPSRPSAQQTVEVLQEIVDHWRQVDGNPKGVKRSRKKPPPH